MLTPNVLSKSSIEASGIDGCLASATPAELTKMWSDELKADSAASNRRLTWVGSEMSAWTVMARGDSAADELIWVATRSACAEFVV